LAASTLNGASAGTSATLANGATYVCNRTGTTAWYCH
jgi:hypothetical protein